jgi:S1-C subfamily serine protease
MLKVLFCAARLCLRAVILAVFFSAGLPAADSSLAHLGQGFNELIYTLSRSIVAVEASRQISVSSFPLTGNEAVQHNVSTGLICDSSGHILVAAQPVIDQDRIVVRFDNHTATAELVGIDYRSGLALLKMDARFGKPIMCSEQQLCAGQMVIMLGNAFGLRASPSVGFCAGARPDGGVQFTVPVSSGSIGAGVFDLSGSLLGMVIGSVDSESRVALAVPGYKIPVIVELLRNGGDRFAGGIDVSAANTLVNGGTRGRRLVERGVVVTRVIPNSAADRAGLRPGDLIFSFRNHPITSAPEFAGQVIQTRPGEVVEIELVRHDTYLAVQLQVDQKELSPASGRGSRRLLGERGSFQADSLSRLIQGLKSQIRQLESQLSSLKR